MHRVLITRVLAPHEYGSVMLPALVLFGLDAVLEPTKPAVLARAQGLDLSSATADPLLRRGRRAAVLQHRSYSPTCPGSVRPAAEVLDAFGYQQTIVKLDKAGVLYAVLDDFADVELHPDVASNEAMGYIFEELLCKFSEMSNETAGEHYTPREIIQLMVDLLLDEDSTALGGEAPVRTVNDPAAGTGGMLTIAEQRLREFNEDATVEVSGQELNPETWAIARLELMMKGIEPGNSLVDRHVRAGLCDQAETHLRERRPGRHAIQQA